MAATLPRSRRVLVTWVLPLLLAAGAAPGEEAADPTEAVILSLLDECFLPETKALVQIQTYRDDTPDSEKRVLENLAQVQAYLQERVDAFNAGQKTLKLQPFQWRKTIDGVDRWVFGYRLGDGSTKIATYCHLDTVGPGGDEWKPFEPRVEDRTYYGETQKFLIGRGTIDDKGPAVISLLALRAAARQFDGTGALDGLTLEAAFDTAEETDEHMPYYVEDTGSPWMGLVYDAMWTVRAEKGLERPVFRVEPVSADSGRLWIESLESSPGPVNQIPATVTARIRGSSRQALSELADSVEERYQKYGFDDPAYRRAPLKVTRDGDAVVLTTSVLGAQHGSAATENRELGANPLVSLAVFLAALVDEGTLDGNAPGRLCSFLSWAWGTRVLGENHPDLLERHDSVFQEGNGTTYAMTCFSTTSEGASLSLDIRYAIGHQSEAWDGKTEGLLGGHSLLPDAFQKLVARFQKERPGPEVTFTTASPFGPDIRLPGSELYQLIDSAFREVTGESSPFLAIGGGTDAKGHPRLVAAGALLRETFGPPINYHGLDEGAPLDDLRTSARILYHLLVQKAAAR